MSQTKIFRKYKSIGNINTPKKTPLFVKLRFVKKGQYGKLFV